MDAWIGVIGVIVGVLASYPFQVLQAKRSEAYERAQRLRADRVSAYSGFAEKIMDWRRSQVIRTMLGIEHGAHPDLVAQIKDENRRVRASAWTAFYQVKLLCGDPKLEELARSAVETTRSMKRASDRRMLNATGDDVRVKLATFLEAAAHQTGSQ